MPELRESVRRMWTKHRVKRRRRNRKQFEVQQEEHEGTTSAGVGEEHIEEQQGQAREQGDEGPSLSEEPQDAYSITIRQR